MKLTVLGLLLPVASTLAVLAELESVKEEDDFTCTHILGSLNPSAPDAAKMSIPPSFPV